MLEYFPLGAYPCGVERRRAQGFADFEDTGVQEAPPRRITSRNYRPFMLAARECVFARDSWHNFVNGLLAS